MNNTKLIVVEQLKPGMVIAEDVYDNRGHLIVSHELQISDKMIMRLKLYSVDRVKVYEQNEDSERSQHGRVKQSNHIARSLEFEEFKEKYLKNVEEFKYTINDIVYGNEPIDKKKILNNINEFVDESPTKAQLFYMLRHLKHFDDSIYMHCYNVAIICRMFGIWLKKSEEEVEVLTMCGLMHDIGMLVILEDLMNGSLDVMQMGEDYMKQHVFKSYEILKDKDIDERVKLVALQHHERRNGSGYPYGLEEDEICEFAQIVAIADTYDDMTAPNHRLPFSPFRVYEFFQEEGYDLFESKFLLPFIEKTEETYLNNKVTLTNGVEGEIIMLNGQQKSKPLIRTQYGFIDLNAEHNIEIEDVL
jgi:HD-GYP domain-containing protein (c-di-GMP phosphodiesterase class II)